MDKDGLQDVLSAFNEVVSLGPSQATLTRLSQALTNVDMTFTNLLVERLRNGRAHNADAEVVNEIGRRIEDQFEVVGVGVSRDDAGRLFFGYLVRNCSFHNDADKGVPLRH